MKITFGFKWFDLWIGAYWDATRRVLYLCPLPCLCFRLEMAEMEDEKT